MFWEDFAGLLQPCEINVWYTTITMKISETESQPGGSKIKIQNFPTWWISAHACSYVTGAEKKLSNVERLVKVILSFSCCSYKCYNVLLTIFVINREELRLVILSFSSCFYNIFLTLNFTQCCLSPAFSIFYYPLPDFLPSCSSPTLLTFKKAPSQFNASLVKTCALKYITWFRFKTKLVEEPQRPLHRFSRFSELLKGLCRLPKLVEEPQIMPLPHSSQLLRGLFRLPFVPLLHVWLASYRLSD